MSLKLGVLVAAASLLAAGSSFAGTSSGSAGQVCAAAAAAAEEQSSASDSQVAACTLAIRIASGGEAEVQILAQLRSGNAIVMPTEAWDRIAAAYINRGVLH